MIQTSLGQLVNAESALAELAKQRLPAKVAYHLANLCKKVGDETAHWHKTRNDTIKELGVEKDGACTVSPDQIGAFVLRMNELAAVEVTVDAAAIAFDVLTDISASDLIALGPLVGEPA